MALGACPICTEPLKEYIVATKCGHVFHEICITTWLLSKRACPTCRAPASPLNLIKLFLASLDESITTVTLPDDNGNTQEELEKCRKASRRLQTQNDDLQTRLAKARESLEERDKEIEMMTENRDTLKHQLKSAKATCGSLRTKMQYLVDGESKRRELEEKNAALKKEVKGLKALHVITGGSAEEVEELVEGTTDIKSMALFLRGMKREYAVLQRSKAEVQGQSEDLQKKLNHARITVQQLRQELDEVRRSKQQVEGDLSMAERRNESLCKKIGEYEDRSILENTDLLNVSKPGMRKSLDTLQTPVHLNKRQRKEHSTPLDDDFAKLTRRFEEDVSRDDELERIAAELEVDIHQFDSPTPAHPAPSSSSSSSSSQSQHLPRDNLFSREGWDGFGGRGKIRKPLPAPRSVFAKKAGQQTSLTKKATLNNMFRKL